MPMGWMETCAVDERMRFVMAVREREEAFAAVCRQFGVSRRTGYKWLSGIGKRASRVCSTTRGRRCIIPKR